MHSSPTRENILDIGKILRFDHSILMEMKAIRNNVLNLHLNDKLPIPFCSPFGRL